MTNFEQQILKASWLKCWRNREQKYFISKKITRENTDWILEDILNGNLGESVDGITIEYISEGLRIFLKKDWKNFWRNS